MLQALNLGFVFASLCLIYYFLKPQKKYRLAPGPWNIPFVSGIFKTSIYPYITFQEWAKQYGPLIRTKFGLRDALIIDDAKLLREAYSQQAFNGKMEYKTFTVLSGGKHGILNGEGQEWAENRRFVLRNLRDFGFGKASMEEIICEEIKEMLLRLKEVEGVATDIKPRIVLTSLNALWTMVAGDRHDQDNSSLEKILQKANKLFNENGNPNSILVLFPKLIDILPNFFLTHWNHFLENAKSYRQIFTDAVQDHLQNPVDQSHPRDLIDVYLTEIKKTKDPTSSFYGDRGFFTLETVINDLYAAGMGTTPHLLVWVILYLVRFPRVQKKFQQELDSVIGRNRHPCLSDKPNLPYTEALTMELHRFCSLTPLGLLHETTEDATLGGYDVKKGTVIIPNYYSINNNKEMFQDPEVFRPERFLSPDEKTVIENEDMMPFGTGKRSCLGEALGKSGLFLFMTSIFQRFEVLPDESKPLPSLDPYPGLFREPELYTVVLKDRY